MKSVILDKAIGPGQKRQAEQQKQNDFEMRLVEV